MICRSIDSLTALLAQYLRKHHVNRASAEQLTVVVTLFNRFYEATYGVPLHLAVLSEDLLEEYLYWLQDTRANGPVRINRQRSYVLTLWRYAHWAGLADEPRAGDVLRFREPERIPRAWTQEELARMLVACDRYVPRRPVLGWDARHDKAIRLVIYDTGFRVAACLALERANLRQDGAILAEAETQKTLCDEGHWLGRDTLSAVREILGDRMVPGGNRLMVPATTSKIFNWPYRKRAFCDRWHKINELAGLGHTRRDGPQKMRRTSASWMEALAPGSAEGHLGHKTPGLAKKHYVDPLIVQSVRRKASDILPRIVNPQRQLF
jgi:integrase